MICPSCQAENPEGARFCQKCGKSLDVRKKTTLYALLAVFVVLFLMAISGLTVFVVHTWQTRVAEQTQRQKLTAIIKNEIRQTPASPLGYKQYSADSYTMSYPDNWLKTTKINSGALEEPTVIFRDLGSRQEVSFTIKVFTIPPGKEVDLEEALKAGLSDTVKRFPNSQVSKKALTLDGRPALKAEYHFLYGSGIDYIDIFFFIKTAGHLYVLEEFVPTNDVHKYNVAFQAMIDSFRAK